MQNSLWQAGQVWHLPPQATEKENTSFFYWRESDHGILKALSVKTCDSPLPSYTQQTSIKALLCARCHSSCWDIFSGGGRQ